MALELSSKEVCNNLLPFALCLLLDPSPHLRQVRLPDVDEGSEDGEVDEDEEDVADVGTHGDQLLLGLPQRNVEQTEEQEVLGGSDIVVDIVDIIIVKLRCFHIYLDGVDGYVEQGGAEHGLVVCVEGGDEAAEDGEAGQPGHQAGVGGGLGLETSMYIDIHNKYLEKVSIPQL